MRIADGDGLAAVTVRALAQALGVTTMSVYTHVNSRDDLLVLIEWAQAGEDVAGDFAKALDALETEVEAGEVKKMLSGEHDAANAIMDGSSA